MTNTTVASLQEAIHRITVRTSKPQDFSATTTNPVLIEVQQRHADVVDQLHEGCPEITRLVENLIHAVAIGKIEPDDAFMTAFGNGVLTGIEMMREDSDA